LPLYVEPAGGMFIWIKIPERFNVVAMASQAATQGITLAPGNLFRPHQEPTPWMRFNVASCHEVELLEFLAGQLAK
ncbi:MAG: aminotransferase domain-containing GntR family transcriptional regulator, partial [Halothiobacillaceae bacterium]